MRWCSKNITQFQLYKWQGLLELITFIRLAELEVQSTTMLLSNVAGPPENQSHRRLKLGSWSQIAWILDQVALSLSAQFLYLQPGHVQWNNEIIHIQFLPRTWYMIKVQLRLAIIIVGFISIVLIHALNSRGSDSGQQVTCNRNKVTQCGKKHRMSRKDVQMKPRTTAFGNSHSHCPMETAHTEVTLGQSFNSIEVDQPLFVQHCVR